MNGYWTLHRPKTDGQYWTADRQGRLAGIKVVAYHNGKCVYAGHSLHEDDQGWQGYWWSYPIEEPPPPRAIEDAFIDGCVDFFPED